MLRVEGLYFPPGQNAIIYLLFLMKKFKERV
jgi:hypothetical protein